MAISNIVSAPVNLPIKHWAVLDALGDVWLTVAALITAITEVVYGGFSGGRLHWNAVHDRNGLWLVQGWPVKGRRTPRNQGMTGPLRARTSAGQQARL